MPDLEREESNPQNEARRIAIAKINEWEYRNHEKRGVAGTEAALEATITNVVFWGKAKTDLDKAAITLAFTRVKGPEAIELYKILTGLGILP